MNKINNTLPVRVPIETDVMDDFNHPLPNDNSGYTKYPKTLVNYIPGGVISLLLELINNQNEIIDKIELISKSNIGKAMLGLEPFPEEKEKKV